MKHVLIALLLIGIGFSTSPAQSCYKVVTYRIDCELKTENKTIHGLEELTWVNTGTVAVQELYFHLYMNAYKNTRSTFLRGLLERAPELIERFGQDGWGYCEVVSFSAKSPGRFDVVSLQPVFVQPDDENNEDKTVFKVDLPRPVPPGGEVNMTIQFVTKLPRQAPRTGFLGDYVFVGQWFPKIGVWLKNEWNCHQFHSTSEFFADYGDYDVRVRLPQEYIIGGCGVITDSTAHDDGTVTYRFQQECIHDFAWTAFPDYKTAVRTFEHPELPTVTMRLLYQPAHKRYVDEFFDATANTLKHLGLWYIPYPYPQITIVDAAWRSHCGGMEYPTLFTTGVSWLTPKGGSSPYGLTVHECAHQFFYGLIGSNEFEHAWLDEGFTTYATARCMNTAYGPMAYGKIYLEREGFGIPLAFERVPVDARDWLVRNHRQRGWKDYVDKFSWDYTDYSAYRNNAYEKPALMLWTLENVLGASVFGDIMKTYAQRYRFKHPGPQDFIDVVNEISPQNMDWFFEQIMNKAGILDYAVIDIQSKTPQPAKGYFGQGKDREWKEEEPTNEKISEVHVRRLGEMRMPVELLVTFEDGESELVEWDGVESFKIFQFSHDNNIEKAELDPYYKIWLDVNPVNNNRFAKGNTFASFRWVSKWLFWLQDLLEVVAVFS